MAKSRGFETSGFEYPDLTMPLTDLYPHDSIMLPIKLG